MITEKTGPVYKKKDEEYSLTTPYLDESQDVSEKPSIGPISSDATELPVHIPQYLREALDAKGQSQEASPGLIPQVLEKAPIAAAEREEYPIHLSPQQWDILSSAANESDDPERELSRFAAATLFSQEYNVPYETALENLDAFSEYLTGRKFENNTTAVQSIVNSFKAGRLNMKYSNLAADFKRLDLKDEDTTEIMTQLHEISEQILALKDNQPRNVVTWMAQVTAESALPYMIEVGKSALIGATMMGLLAVGWEFVAGVTLGSLAAASAFTLAELISIGASVASINRTRELEEGVMYLQLRQAGIDKDIANSISRFTGIVVGWTEVAMGVEFGTIARAIGGEAGSKLSARLITSGWFQGFVKGLLNLTENAANEFIQESSQELTGIAGVYLGHAIQKHRGEVADLPDIDILKDTFEAGLAGFASAIVLGLPGFGVDVKGGFSKAVGVRNEARINPSKESFIKQVQEAKPDTMSANEWNQAMSNLWEKENSEERQSSAIQTDASAVAELDTGRGKAVAPQGEVKRLESGRLYLDESDTVQTDTSGVEHHRLLAGDPISGSRYGYIDYSLDGNTLSIDGVYVRSGYESIRKETIIDLARQYPGYEVQWDAASETLQTLKEEIIAENPQGTDKGLQYFDGITDVSERMNIESQIVKAMPSLNAAERSLGATLIQLRAETQNMDAQSYIDATYKDGQMFGTIDAQMAEVMQGKKGAVQFEQDLKAIIYTGQNADFSTFAHETFHVSLRQMQGQEQLSSAIREAAQSEQFSQWLDEHKQLFSDSNFSQMQTSELVKIAETFNESALSRQQEEFAARLFEGYLLDGKSASQRLSSFLERVAVWMRKIYETISSKVQLDDRIVQAFDSMLESESKLKQERSANEGALNTLYQEAPATESEAFKKWFGDSKVVDEKGSPLTLYHGSSMEDIKEFNKGARGIIYGTDDQSLAQDYAGRTTSASKEDSGKVYELYARIENPATIEDSKVIDILYERWSDDSYTKEDIIEAFEEGYDPYELLEDSSVIQALKNAGYDGVQFYEEGSTSYGVFSPNQIKSINNQGTWNAANPNILFQEKALKLKQAILDKSANSDKSMLFQEIVENIEKGTLAVLHNISQQNISKTQEIGGLPSPSLAITRLDIDHDQFNEFGDVTLVAHPAIAYETMEDQRLYDRDVWSPTVPRATWRVNESVLKKFDTLVSKLSSKTSPGFNSFYKGDIESGITSLTYQYKRLESVQKAFTADTGLKHESNDKAFTKWVMSHIKEAYTEPVIQINSRKYAYNAQNILRWMKLQGPVATQLSLTYTPTKASSHAARAFANRSQVKFAEGSLITQQQQQDHWNDTILPVMHTVESELLKQFKGREWDVYDSIYKTIGQYISKYGQQEQIVPMQHALSRNGFSDVSHEVAKSTIELANLLSFVPQVYFEAKPNRVMQLNEFVAAIVPPDIISNQRQVLENNNLQIFEYDGSSQSKMDALSIAYEKLGTDILFQEDEFSYSEMDLQEARGFDSWQEFYDFYNAMVLPGESIPSEDAWYINVWEKAHNITEETSEATSKQSETLLTDKAKDDQYRQEISTDKGITTFMSELSYILSNMGMRDMADMGEDASELARREVMERIRLDAPSMLHPTIISNAYRGVAGRKLTQRAISSIRTLMSGEGIRYYRDIYADVMDRQELKSEVIDSRLPKIDDPGYRTLDTFSITERLRLADHIEATDLKKKLLSGQELMDGSAEMIVKDMDRQIGELNKRIVVEETKLSELKHQYGKAVIDARQFASEYKNARKMLDDSIRKIRNLTREDAKIPKGVLESHRSVKANFDLLHKQVVDMRKSERMAETIKRQTALTNLKEQLREKQKAKDEARKVRQYKLSLARKIMAKPSDAINFEQAKAIYETQAPLDPAYRMERILVNVNDEQQRMTIAEAQEYFAGSTEEDIRRNIGDKNYLRLTEQRKPLNEWTVLELESLAESVANLRAEGRRILEAKKARQIEIARRIQGEIIQTLVESGKYKDRPIAGSHEEHVEKSSPFRSARALRYATLPMRAKAMMLDNDTMGAAYKLLVTEKRNAQDVENRSIDSRVDPIVNLMRDLKIKDTDLYKTVGIQLDQQASIKMTYPALMYAYLSQFNKENRNAVAYGNLVTQDEKANLKHDNDVIKKLGDQRYRNLISQAEYHLNETPGMMEIAKAIQDDFNNPEHLKKLQDISIQEFNRPMREVDSYLSIQRLSVDSEVMDQQIMDDLFNKNAGALPTGVQKGFTRERINISPDHQRPVNMDLIQVWNRAVRQQEHFTAFAEYGRNVNRVFKGRGATDVRNVISRTLGTEMLHDIDNYINDVINPSGERKYKAMEKAVGFMRGNLGAAYLTWKMSSIVLQAITSPAPFLIEVSPLYMAKGYFELMAHPLETINKINELSPMMKHRTMNLMISDILERSRQYHTNIGSKMLYKAQEIGSLGLTWVDRYAVAGGWLGAYYQQKEALMKNGMSEQEAHLKSIAYADDITLKTQPTGDATEIAPLFVQGSEFARAFTQFTTAMNVIWTNITYDLPVAVKGMADKSAPDSARQANFARAIGTIVGYGLAGAILGAVQEGFKEDDDEDKKLKRLIHWSFTQGTESVPLIGRGVDAVIESMITGDRVHVFADNFFPGMDKLVQGVIHLTQEDFDKGLRRLAEGVGYMIGAPVSGINQAIKTIKEGPKAMLGR